MTSPQLPFPHSCLLLLGSLLSVWPWDWIIHWSLVGLLMGIQLKALTLSQNLSVANSSSGRDHRSPFPIQNWLLTSPILWNPSTGNHSNCEFMITMTMSCLEDGICSSFSEPLALISFLPLILWCYKNHKGVLNTRTIQEYKCFV